MHKNIARLALPVVAAGLIGAPMVVNAAGGRATSAKATPTPKATATAKPGAARPTATPRRSKPPTPTPAPTAVAKLVPAKTVALKPVNVYVGKQLVATGQSISASIAQVRGQVPFAIKAPSYAPSGYVPVQLAVTPRQSGVSTGFSTLTYTPTSRGRTPVTTSGFQVNQSANPLPFVKSTGTVTTTVGGSAALLDEFKAGKTDLLILTWTDASGIGYTVTTDAGSSHLSRTDLVRVASSLR